MAGVNWYGPQFDAELNAKVERKLDAAAIKVSTRVKKLLSVPGRVKKKYLTGRRTKLWRDAGETVSEMAHDGNGRMAERQIRAADSTRAVMSRLKDRKVWLGEHKASTKTYVVSIHAPPGEPPYKQTGRLRASITWEKPAPMVRRVGTNVKYGRNQELGITVRPHPFLRPGLALSGPDIDRLFSS